MKTNEILEEVKAQAQRGAQAGLLAVDEENVNAILIKMNECGIKLAEALSGGMHDMHNLSVAKAGFVSVHTIDAPAKTQHKFRESLQLAAKCLALNMRLNDLLKDPEAMAAS